MPANRADVEALLEDMQTRFPASEALAEALIEPLGLFIYLDEDGPCRVIEYRYPEGAGMESGWNERPCDGTEAEEEKRGYVGSVTMDVWEEAYGEDRSRWPGEPLLLDEEDDEGTQALQADTRYFRTWEEVMDALVGLFAYLEARIPVVQEQASRTLKTKLLR